MDIHSGIQNIVVGQGIKIAISGMIIVFAALTLISFFIYYLPKILGIFTHLLPPEEAPHNLSVHFAALEDEAIAAIGFVLHNRNR